MDYIQEELLRQKKALAMLMNGGALGKEDADRAETAEAAKNDLIWQEVIETARKQVLEEVALGRTGSSSIRGLVRDAVSKVTASEFNETVRPVAGMTRNYRLDALRVPDHIAPRERAATGATTDVRDLSRSIQRDARRYDGGFSIY